MPRPKVTYFGSALLSSATICVVLLYVASSDTTIQITYPSHWYESRSEFGFPFHFKAFYMPVFADWKTNSPNLKSWQYLSTGNYEVPRYVKEGFWIPDGFKLFCVPEATSLSYADLINLFTGEDFAKDIHDSIRQQFTLSGKYYDQGYFTILYYLLNLCQCLRKRYTDLHCPNPCWRPNICNDVEHSTGVCHPVQDSETRLQIHHRLRAKLRDVYDFDYRCDCEPGYQFNRTEKKCTPALIECTTRDCYNGGVCETLPVSRRGNDGMTHVCHCPPAWQGPMCEQPRNPCKLTYHLCEPFQCFRDPNNRIKGYSCACPRGMRSASHSNPRCVNVDECKELTNPCLNGGACVDRHAPVANAVQKPGEPYGYACLCRHGYSGARCDRPPSSLYWSGWSLWSRCSASCGLGVHTRHRTCPVRDRCVGTSTESSRCMGPVTSCADAAGDSDVIPYGLGTKVVQSWGIGWTADEDRSLNDAFFWSENEDGWPTLYFKKEGFQFADILTWTKLTQLSRRWSLEQLMVYHAVVLGLVSLPILVIFLALSKVIQHFIRRRQPRPTETEDTSGQ